MKLPAFVRQITAKKNGRRPRRSSDSPSSEDDAAVVGLHLDRSGGKIEKEELAPKQAPTSIGTGTEAVPPRNIPSIDEFSSEPEHHFEDATSSPSSHDQHLETKYTAALPQRQNSVSLLNDDLSQITNSKFELSRSLSLLPTRRMPRKKFMGSLSMSMASLSHGMENATGKCPFKHGTVYSGPYPGYVHGNPKRGICPNGCKAEINRVITEGESTAETMMREAMEYLELYYHERNEDMSGTEGFLPKKERMVQVRRDIQETGTYAHTFDELGKISFFIM